MSANAGEENVQCDHEYAKVYGAVCWNRKEARTKPRITNLISKINQFLDDDEETEHKIKAARLERQDLYRIFQEFINTQSAQDILLMSISKVDIGTNKPNGGFGELLTDFFTERKDHQPLLESTAAALTRLVEARKEVPAVIAAQNVLKAAMLLYAYQNRVVYPRVMDHVLKEQKRNPACYVAAMHTLERKGLLKPITKDELTYRFQRQKHETKLKSIRNRQWFTMTKMGEELIREHLDALKAIVPSEILARSNIDTVYAAGGGD